MFAQAIIVVLFKLNRYKIAALHKEEKIGWNIAGTTWSRLAMLSALPIVFKLGLLLIRQARSNK